MKAKLVIDCGNSETRYWADVPGIGQFAGALDNAYAREAVISRVDDVLSGGAYTATDSVALRFQRGTLSSLRGTYLGGLVRRRNFERVSALPALSSLKYEEPLVYVAIVAVLDTVLSRASSASSEGVSKSRLVEVIDWSLVLLAPPMQVEAAKARFRAELQSGFSYRDCISGIDVTPKISRVEVVPEGMSAYVGLRVTSSGLLRDGFADLDQRNVLILDIGAGTCDVVGVSGGQLVESSRATIVRGGRHVVEVVQQSLEKELGRTLSPSLFTNTFSSGTVQIGDEVRDVTDLLEQGLDAVAGYLVDDIRTHFGRSTIELAAFDRLVVIGGGAMEPLQGQGGLPSLAELILEDIQRDVPGIKLLSVDDHLATFEGDASQLGLSVLVHQPLRYLNLLGAVTLSRTLGS